MCVVNKQFELFGFVFYSIYNEIHLTCVVCMGCEYAERVRGCKDDGNDGVGCVVVVSAGHEYVGGTRGSGIVSSAGDVLKVSVMRGMRGVGGECKVSMFLARGGVGCEG